MTSQVEARSSLRWIVHEEAQAVGKRGGLDGSERIARLSRLGNP